MEYSEGGALEKKFKQFEETAFPAHNN